MVQGDAYQDLLDSLRAAAGLLNLDRTSQLQRDIVAVCDQWVRPSFRIAVFGPFNYGKSTLLNALLGERALPIDLIPTTGAAITVRYGNELQTRIQLVNGTAIHETGTEVLKRFAILDDNRCMRQDVASVEVLCPHPFLKTGVELVDLPGTDDREAQDALVKDQLLTADLIVQVLDGRKLMTLGEREHLRDWLQDRGIETVVFVVNFLNLLEPDEQKQVYNRLRFVAESFRSKLPAGISNLYRVDALPALRARLKGDMPAAQVAGLPSFESALQTIVEGQRQQTEARLPRVRAIAQQVKQTLQTSVDQVTVELAAVEAKRQQKIQIKQKAVQLIRKGFETSVTEFSDWLSLTHLLNCYQTEAAQALQQGTFKTWETGAFKRAAIDHQQAVAKWVHQACEFFDRPRPNQLLIAFPPEPQLVPPEPSPPTPSSKSTDVTPVAIATGLGWVLGGPVGGAILGGASYLLNKTLDSDKPQTSAPSAAPATYLYLDAVREYLVNFSAINLSALQKYETVADRIIHFDPLEEPTEITEQHHQLELLRSTLARLDQTLAN
ncbi:dynamin family protein [Kovacikia minuta CCNUW1]|uniref:dynamin family protein n=1 Tax=Kovacikia minuta TaxID=2931930 RepID=UPI001CC920A4|nr:dynamin family protein [Kovacikia minuta]UBF23652.1 dynamin family protein [Kovacikia minuta CCNUW1]